MSCVLEVNEAGEVVSAALLRTARKLMDGVVFAMSSADRQLARDPIQAALSSRRQAQSTRIATCSARWRSSRSAPRPSIFPRRRAGHAVRPARSSRLCAQCHRPGELPRHRQCRDAGCHRQIGRQRRAASRWSIRRSPMPSLPRCTQAACAACGSTSSSGWSTMRPRTSFSKSRGDCPRAGMW